MAWGFEAVGGAAAASGSFGVGCSVYYGEGAYVALGSEDWNKEPPRAERCFVALVRFR
jgi:hypothetical protein